MSTMNSEEINRYVRQILLPEIGLNGQIKLSTARVLLIGAGGLCSPALLYLAAVGIGTLGIIDNDIVELSNLQRQIIYSTRTLRNLKVESSAEVLLALNPSLKIEVYPYKFEPEHALSLVRRYDIIVDGSDNFRTRFLTNDVCFLAKKALVSAAIIRFSGYLSTFKPGGACYRCLFPVHLRQVPSCAEAGILGSVAGVLGALQSIEVIKEILGIGISMSSTLMIYNALSTNFRRIKVNQDPFCPLCGISPTIFNVSV